MNPKQPSSLPSFPTPSEEEELPDSGSNIITEGVLKVIQHITLAATVNPTDENFIRTFAHLHNIDIPTAQHNIFVARELAEFSKGMAQYVIGPEGIGDWMEGFSSNGVGQGFVTNGGGQSFNANGVVQNGFGVPHTSANTTSTPQARPVRSHQQPLLPYPKPPPINSGPPSLGSWRRNGGQNYPPPPGFPRGPMPKSDFFVPSGMGPSGMRMRNGLPASPPPVKSKFCPFCKKKGNPARVYESHDLHDTITRQVICPALSSVTCKFCGATGGNAHTPSYCPKVNFSNPGANY